MTMNETMLKIKALDSGATLKYSEYTESWFVSSRIEVGNGSLLRGVSEHADTPEQAVDRYWNALIVEAPRLGDTFLVTSHLGERREWQWNGAAFAEVTGLR